jgi:hypothetical protein
VYFVRDKKVVGVFVVRFRAPLHWWMGDVNRSVRDHRKNVRNVLIQIENKSRRVI